MAVANACLTAKFDYGECIGEAFLRQPDGGAIGYIGGSNNTYWDEDYYWAVGYGPIVGAGASYDETGLGAYDGMFHDHGESYSTWCTVNGAISVRGNLAVAESGSDLENYYWEIYTLLGDPTLSTNLGQPTLHPATYPDVIITGTPDFTVEGDPWTLVSLNSEEGHLITGRIDSTGSLTLPLADLNLTPGPVELVLTAQNRIPIFDTLQVIAPDGPYLIAANPTLNDSGAWNANAELDFGETCLVGFTIQNVGLGEAQNISVTLTTSDLFTTITPRTVWLATLDHDSIAVVDSFEVSLAGNCPDGRRIELEALLTDGTGQVWTSPLRLTAHAPVITPETIRVDDGNNGRLDINEIADIVLDFSNSGSCFSPSGTAQLTSMDPYVALINSETSLDSILTDSSREAAFTIRVLPTTPPGHEFRFQWTINSDHGYSTFGSFQLPAGLIIEDFETGDFSSFDWTFSGDADWIITQDPVWEGAFSAVSGDVDDYQQSSLILNVSCPQDREIQFTFKVSSEANYDGLEFYIDNTRYGPWQGEIDWQDVTFPIPAGEHTLTWKYVKDQGVTHGSDCAWLDYIILPLVGPSGFHCIPGDVNGDDQITVLDIFRMVFMVMNQGLEPTDEEAYCADVNYDGVVDIFDILEAGDRRTDQ